MSSRVMIVTPEMESAWATERDALIDESYADGRKDEREQCCKDICESCGLGYPVSRRSGRQKKNRGVWKWGQWVHTGPDGYERLCQMTKIRERAFKEQAKDE